jgi:RHS repeat-associated protein
MKQLRGEVFMKSFKYFILLGVLFFIIIFQGIDSSYAGTLNATLGGGGGITLVADFCGDFDCTLDSDYVQIIIPYQCVVAREDDVCSLTAYDAFICPHPGQTRGYRADALGGRIIEQTGLCGGYSSYATASVTDTEDIFLEIVSPSGERVEKGVVPIAVDYNFKYDNTDACGRTASRWISGTGISLSGLPVSGTATGSITYTQTGYYKITETASCGFGKIVDKTVYVGNPEADHDNVMWPMGNRDNTKPANNPTIDHPCVMAGKPVSVVSGKVETTETDFSLSGIMPINFVRYYNSRNTENGKFGPRWSHPFDKRAVAWGNNSYKIITDDGTIYYYTDNDGDKIYQPELPKGLKSKVIKNPDNTIVREFNNGMKEEYDRYGYLTGIVDRNGNRISLTRDSYYKLTKITDPSGREINISYASNLISQITLPNGNTINYTYLSGKLQKVTYPDGSQRIYEYSVYNLTGIKNEKGNYIEKHIYDAQGRAITSSADGTNELITINYIDDAHSTVTDSFGRVTTYTFDKSKGMSHATNISGPGCKECGQGNVSYSYDDNLNMTSITDGNGNVTTFTYDSNGNMLTKTEAYGTPLQRTITYTYEPTYNQVTSITDPLGRTTNFAYDIVGNLTSITDPAGAITSFTRNTQGLITQITDAQGNSTDFTYDLYGNIATITDSLGNVTSYTYDVMGKLLSVTDARGNQTNYTYDLRDRLTQVRDSLNNLTTYTYDLAGNLTAITDAKGNATQFLYDSINRLIRETNALGNQRNYTYDSQSNLISKTDANGQTTTYTYNDYNRLITISHPGGSQSTFTYDTLGNLTGASNPNISYTITYDALNRKTSITDNLSRTINYTYDANSNRATMVDPTGTTTYVYDVMNRLTSMTDPAPRTYTFTYDNLGRRTSLNLPNGITTSYTYDNLSRLLSIINGSISSNSYSYDNVGNRASMTDPSGTHNYAYDVIYRLLQATHPAPPTEQFTYDEVGNRLTDGSGNSYFYNNANRLLNYNGVTFTYDTNGNMTSRVDSCGTTTYTWNSEDRLTGISGFKPDCSTLVASYKYDPFGRRIEKNINGVITKYLYDEEDIIAEYDGNNQLVAHYIHGPGIDEPLSMEKNSQKYYYHVDALGSVTAITDSVGTVVQRYNYDSFGNITYMQDPNFIQPYTYTSREYDPDSGLYYYRARYYDAKVGRFISEDPIGLKGRINIYVYVGNNTVNRIDPSGKMAAVTGGVIAIGGGGAVLGFTYCMDNCMGGIDTCQKKDPFDENWNNKFAQCAKLCVSPTGLWEFLIEPLGASLKAIIEGSH